MRRLDQTLPWLLGGLALASGCAVLAPLGWPFELFAHFRAQYFAAALVLAAANLFIRPVFYLLSLPFIVVTLGLFIWLINAFMLWVTSLLVPPFDLYGFWKTIGAAFILWIANMLVGGIMRDFIEKPEREPYLVD